MKKLSITIFSQRITKIVFLSLTSPYLNTRIGCWTILVWTSAWKSPKLYVTFTILDIDATIHSLVEPYENAIQLLCTIPGIDHNNAITIISEIGTDIPQFSISKRLYCWAGLTPGNNESAGKKKSVRITRAGVYLKPALVQVAHAAVKSNKSPNYQANYERIAKHHGKKRAIISIAIMNPTAIYHMLSTGKLWNPTDGFSAPG